MRKPNDIARGDTAAGRSVHTNVHIYPSVFQQSSRILKQTRSIVDAGLADQVIIVAMGEPGLPQEERIDAQRTIIRLPLATTRFGKNLFTEMLAYVELLIRTLWYLRNHTVSFANAHSLSVLPTTAALRAFKGATIVYDTHELETERNGLRGMRKAVSKTIEKLLMPFVSCIAVVSPSILAWYRNAYPGKPVQVVRNIPVPRTTNKLNRSTLRTIVDADDDEILFIYQGNFGNDRGIESILAAFESVTNTKVRCVFMGKGALTDMIRAASNRCEQIDLIPPVSSDKVLDYSCGADVGLCLIIPSCLSYRFCLPNKLFEYIGAGVPILITPGPDMQAVIQEHANGWAIDGDADSLLSFLNGLNCAELDQKKRNAINCVSHFNWQTEESEYIQMLERALAAKRD